MFAEIGERVRASAVPLAGTEPGRAELSTGAGGDTTVEIDRLAETAALDVLERLAGSGERFSVLSEEIGERSFGAPFPLVLIDPIDGSLNAKQGLPLYAVMLSVLDGPRLEDTVAGYVLNLVSMDAWYAVRGGGAYLRGERLRPLRPRPGRHQFELVAVESSPRSLARAEPVLRLASKVRILGSMALSIAHTASGGIDVFLAPFAARAFDMSASLLILSEAGGLATDLEGAGLGAVRAGLDQRTTLLCASDAALHGRALEALRG